MNILVIGGGLQGLSCGKSLCGNNAVSIVSSDLMIRHSRFFKKVYNKQTLDYDGLTEILKLDRYDILLPVSDVAVSLISKNKRSIETEFGVKCAVPDYSKVAIVEDKSRFMSFCDNAEIPHPETYVLTEKNLNDIVFKEKVSYVIKPNYSVGARGITKVNSKAELQKVYPIISKEYGPCTLQEYINNDHYYNVILYRDANGDYPSYTISKIVRMYPIEGGSSSCCITVNNDELLNVCKDCLDKLEWNGLADLDVLQRRDNGKYQIIEINPRAPASLKAAAISGVNFPGLIVSDVMGHIYPDNHYRPGKILRYLGLDIMWFVKSSHKFCNSPSWLSFVGSNIFYQDIYAEDPSTWWTWLIEGIEKLIKRKRRVR